MECREARRLAEGFVTGQPLCETAQDVIAHLARCPTCHDEVEGLRRLRVATRSAFECAADLKVSPTFAATLASRLQGEAVRERREPTPHRRWMAVAASVLLVVGAAWGWREWSASSFAGLVRVAVDDHRFCALTFKLAEHSIPLDVAAQRYGGVYRVLETVDPSTTSLNGGPLRILKRHACVLNGRRFAHIVLRYKDETVSLLVTDNPRLWRPLARASKEPAEWPASYGLHVASFGGGQHTVFVVSSLNNGDVQEVARALVGPVSRALAGA